MSLSKELPNSYQFLYYYYKALVIMGKDHPDANLHPEATGLAAKTVQVSVAIHLHKHINNIL